MFGFSAGTREKRGRGRKNQQVYFFVTLFTQSLRKIHCSFYKFINLTYSYAPTTSSIVIGDCISQDRGICTEPPSSKAEFGIWGGPAWMSPALCGSSGDSKRRQGALVSQFGTTTLCLHLSLTHQDKIDLINPFTADPVKALHFVILV